MKKFFPVILFLAGALTLSAQTNMSNTNAVNAILALVTTNSPAASARTNPPPATPKVQHGPMTIKSDGPLVLDMINHWLVYSDHVSVSDPQGKMTCERLEANIPQNGEHPTNIVALTNVVLDFTDDKGQKIHATGGKAVYYYHVENGVTNDTVTLSINSEVDLGPEGEDKTKGDAIIWDRITDVYTVSNPIGVYLKDADDTTMTNSSAVKTNAPTINTNPPTVTKGG